jgi:hypothetical protein
LDTLTIASGALATFVVTIRDADGDAVTTYAGTEPLSVAYWPGGALPAGSLSASSGAAWLDESAGTITVTLDDSDTPSLTTGDHLVIRLDDGGDMVEVYRAALAVHGNPAPGATDDERADAAADALTAALAGPRRVRGDAGEVEQHDLADLIAAEKYLAAKCAGTTARRGLRITKLLPGGTE